jgi:hypothetical protein
MMANGYGPSYDPPDYNLNPTPEWFTGSSMNYQSPSLVSDIGSGGTPNYLYKEAFGGYGLNQPMQANNSGSWWSNASGLDKMSAVGKGVQAFSTLASLYLGFKGLKEQKKQFKFTKSAWNKNFAAQLGSYDNALRDNYEKYRMGNAYFGNTVESEDEWMSSRSLFHLGS